MDYIHEPVLMHYVLGFFKQFPVPHILVVRLVLDGINHCGGRERNTLNLWIIWPVKANLSVAKQPTESWEDTGSGTINIWFGLNISASWRLRETSSAHLAWADPRLQRCQSCPVCSVFALLPQLRMRVTTTAHKAAETESGCTAANGSGHSCSCREDITNMMLRYSHCFYSLKCKMWLEKDKASAILFYALQ